MNINADDYYGKTITAAAFEDNRLTLTFDTGEAIDIWDRESRRPSGCGTYRHMHTDDKVEDLVGKKLTQISVKPVMDGAYVDGGGMHREIAFLEVSAQHEHIVITNYNEHNGHYGGFEIEITKAHPNNAELAKGFKEAAALVRYLAELGTPGQVVDWYLQRGERPVTELLGFPDVEDLISWARNNPQYWGNDHGGRMFWDMRAYGKDRDETLTPDDIIDWLVAVADRLEADV